MGFGKEVVFGFLNVIYFFKISLMYWSNLIRIIFCKNEYGVYVFFSIYLLYYFFNGEEWWLRVVRCYENWNKEEDIWVWILIFLLNLVCYFGNIVVFYFFYRWNEVNFYFLFFYKCIVGIKWDKEWKVLWNVKIYIDFDLDLEIFMNKFFINIYYFYVFRCWSIIKGSLKWLRRRGEKMG